MVSGGDSGICISLAESDRLKDANGLRFFSAFLSKLPVGGPIMLFRLFITVPSRRRPPRGVCRGCASGARGTSKRNDVSSNLPGDSICQYTYQEVFELHSTAPTAPITGSQHRLEFAEEVPVV